MDEFELDDLEEPKERERSVYKVARWRPKIGRRLLDRAQLIAAWLRITVLPRYGWRALISMVLITGGRLADAASFVVGIHILTRSLSAGNIASNEIQVALIGAAFGLAGVLALGSSLGYIGNKLAAKLVLDYEGTCLAEGLSIVRYHRDKGLEMSPLEITNVVNRAPQRMSRSLLYIINACTAFVLLLIGLAVCIKLFPMLTVIVLLSLIMISPFYILAAVHGTNIGHSIRLNAPGYGQMLRRLQQKWLSEIKFDSEQLVEEIQNDTSYSAYREAYRARLELPARNNLLSSLTLSLVVAVSFIWIANEVELSASSVAGIVSYLVALRLFAHGLSGIFQGVQNINTSLPLFFVFLTRDPRFTKTA